MTNPLRLHPSPRSEQESISPLARHPHAANPTEHTFREGRVQTLASHHKDCLQLADETLWLIRQLRA